MNSRKPTLLVAAAFALIAGSCSNDSSEKPLAEDPQQGTSLRGAGATFPAPLYAHWFPRFEELQPDVTVSYEAVGSGDGVKRFVGKDVELSPADLIDFGASDSAMTDAEIAEVARGVQLVPMTAGTVVVAYNLPGLVGDLKLSRSLLADIFLGKITNWNDPRIVRLNPGAATLHATITMVVRNDSSGTTFAMTNHLSAISEEWRARYGAVRLADWPGTAMRMNGNERVAVQISRSPGAIGYVQFGIADRLELNMALLENKAGQFMKPNARSGSATLESLELPSNLRAFAADPRGVDNYPIITLSWILLYKRYEDPKQATAIKSLFRWCLTEGQSSAPEFGFLPLTENIYEPALAALDGIGGDK